MSQLSNPSQALLRQREQLSGRILLCSPPADAIAADLRQTGAEVSVLSWDHTAVNACRGAVAEERLFTDLALPADAQWDQIALFMPKAREMLDLMLSVVAPAVKHAQHIWLVGEKREGVESAAKRLAKEGWDATKVDSARHCQVWQLIPADDWAPQQNDFWRAYELTQAKVGALQLFTLPGVFSAGRLDEGTQVLLESLPELRGRRFLDFGCGCGVIGTTLKKRYPKASVELTDINLLALKSAARTAEANNAELNIYASDGLAEVQPGVDAIVTNPPFHQGVKQDTRITQQFLRDCARVLKPGGSLTLVANRFLPYPDWIEAHVGPVRVLFENSRFKVYHAVR
ncbi:class I SAM-dependent methyltransferase [Hahella aquimaris]|uniref:class I SAM-dependent methyltransferase n=1 Tax=Hahella sp. HNIBRBA332 TaxID=3015983 RepID=UPI00273C790E|nr:class I SAM-dependent methyltransferase [Hahella sp. HNIBRBA332]WLQ17392.1 class I SAM-dependent methyltransferase [Hahella sp. HNIBRBA332]